MIIKPFNLLYFTLLFVTIGLVIVFSIVFKNKSEFFKKMFIFSIGVFNLVFFIVYKYWLYIDDYPFDIWLEMPLHLCNINIFIISIGVLIKNKYLLTFGGIVGPLGALMALTFPYPNFFDNSIFLLRNIGYYGTHLVIILMGLLIFGFGFIKPELKNLKCLVICSTCLSLFIFLLNLLFRWISGSDVNYFYTMHPNGISILEVFWNLIPVPYLYLLPAILLLVVYFFVVFGLYKAYFYLKNKIKLEK